LCPQINQDFWALTMTKEQAIEIAANLARTHGFKIGVVVNVLYDPIIRLDELWEPAFASVSNRPNQWKILFDLPETKIDPGTLSIAVNDQSGRAVIRESM
jgi:hypothetical protein